MSRLRTILPDSANVHTEVLAYRNLRLHTPLALAKLLCVCVVWVFVCVWC
jgi:hypothetical protein